MDKVEFDFAIITVGDHFLIGEMKEGSDILEDAIRSVVTLARERFGDQPWAYISHRLHSYSHQPAAQVLMHKLDANLVAYAVVLGHPGHAVLLDLEKNLAEGQHAFEVFGDLEDAISWVKPLIK